MTLLINHLDKSFLSKHNFQRPLSGELDSWPPLSVVEHFYEAPEQ